MPPTIHMGTASHRMNQTIIESALHFEKTNEGFERKSEEAKSKSASETNEAILSSPSIWEHDDPGEGVKNAPEEFESTRSEAFDKGTRMNASAIGPLFLVIGIERCRKHKP